MPASVTYSYSHPWKKASTFSSFLTAMKNSFTPRESFYDSNENESQVYSTMPQVTLTLVGDYILLPLHKKWNFPLRISSLNMTKSAGKCGFDHIYWRNPQWKILFICAVCRFQYFAGFSKKCLKNLYVGNYRHLQVIQVIACIFQAILRIILKNLNITRVVHKSILVTDLLPRGI